MITTSTSARARARTPTGSRNRPSMRPPQSSWKRPTCFPGGLRRNQHQFRLVDGETLRGRDLTSSERAGGSFLASNTITTNTGRSRALIAYDGNEAGSGGVAPTVGDPGTTAKAAANGFTRTGHTFTGWNTRRDGTGTACQARRRRRIPGRGADFDPVRAMEADNLHYPPAATGPRPA